MPNKDYRMNNRIEELFKQTNLHRNDHTTAQRRAEVEKFAELIVRECVKLYNHDDVLAPVGNSAWGEAYQEGWTEGTTIYRETIKEHFGVE
jgi:hypothetical protein